MAGEDFPEQQHRFHQAEEVNHQASRGYNEENQGLRVQNHIACQPQQGYSQSMHQQNAQEHLVTLVQTILKNHNKMLFMSRRKFH